MCFEGSVRGLKRRSSQFGEDRAVYTVYIQAGRDDCQSSCATLIMTPYSVFIVTPAKEVMILVLFVFPISTISRIRHDTRMSHLVKRSAKEKHLSTLISCCIHLMLIFKAFHISANFSKTTCSQLFWLVNL